jgi:hypothetical protein
MSVAQVKSALGEVRSQQQSLKADIDIGKLTLLVFRQCAQGIRLLQRRPVPSPEPQPTAYHQKQASFSPQLQPTPQWYCTLPHDRKIVVDKEELDYILRLLRFLENLALLLQRTLQFLLTCSKFGRFPNRQRPRCTTMPWSIWPSLVVLWGVCWMFYTPFTTLDATRFERYFDDEQLSPFVPGKTSHRT